VASSASAFSLPLLASGVANAGSAAAALPTPRFYRAHIDGRKLRAIVDHADACVLLHCARAAAAGRGRHLPPSRPSAACSTFRCAQIVLGRRPQFARRVARRPRGHKQQGARVRARAATQFIIPPFGGRGVCACIYVVIRRHPLAAPPARPPQRAAAHGRRFGRGCARVARRRTRRRFGTRLKAAAQRQTSRARVLARLPRRHSCSSRRRYRFCPLARSSPLQTFCVDYYPLHALIPPVHFLN